MQANILKSKMALKELSLYDLLKELKDVGVHISKTSWYRKLNGKTEFSLQEIKGIIEVLGLSEAEVREIFLA